jgi:hypothetical protein
MKKLTVYCSILLAFGILFSAAINAQAQISKPDWGDVVIQVPKPNAGGLKNPLIPLTDKNFEPQKFTPPLGFKPGIAYEVWITTDGVMHCKTNSTLKTASFSFTAPIKYLTNANDGEPSVGDGAIYIPKLNKPEGSDAYLFDLAKTNYKVKHAINLFIVSTSGSQAGITLINKKVPAKIEE